jgi:hypothetical protein
VTNEAAMNRTRIVAAAVGLRFGPAALLIISSLAAGGCAPLPNSALDAQALRGRSLEVVIQPTPSFYADNRRRRRFGLLGVFAMAYEGNRLIREHRIPDPSLALAGFLRRSVAVRSRLAAQAPGRDRVPQGVATAGTAEGGGPELTLSVRTTNWEYRPFRGASDQFYVIYSARLDLIDNVRRRTIGTERCQVTPTVDERLTEGELTADDAAKLRAELALASEQCFAALRDGTLAAALGLGPAVARR